jgi:hypothetical protein
MEKAMPITKIWVFETYDEADKARNALIESGFPHDDVQFTTRQEEAGPVEGNWMLPPRDTDEDKQEGFLHSLVADSDEATENYTKADVTQRGSFLLTINAQNDNQATQVDDQMRRFGGVDINDRTPG